LLICFNIIKDMNMSKLSEELTAREQKVLLWERWGPCVYVIWLHNKNEKLWWVQSQYISNTFKFYAQLVIATTNKHLFSQWCMSYIWIWLCTKANNKISSTKFVQPQTISNISRLLKQT
jgi:hypothetical protein